MGENLPKSPARGWGRGEGVVEVGAASQCLALGRSGAGLGQPSSSRASWPSRAALRCRGGGGVDGQKKNRLKCRSLDDRRIFLEMSLKFIVRGDTCRSSNKPIQAGQALVRMASAGVGCSSTEPAYHGSVYRRANKLYRSNPRDARHEPWRRDAMAVSTAEARGAEGRRLLAPAQGAGAVAARPAATGQRQQRGLPGAVYAAQKI